MLLTHRLRAAHDAILVGIGTVLADDPRLTVRLVGGLDPQPVILDSHLRMSEEAALLKEHRHPWVATLEDSEHKKIEALEGAGARLLRIPGDGQGHVALPALLQRLAALDVKRLMVEGGASVITGFIAQRLVNLVVITIAPVFVGGLGSIDRSFSQPSAQAVFPRLEDLHAAQMGSDLIVWGTPARL